jgi:hypothetical protein
MNLEKTVLEGDLWYIDNFLTEEELSWFKPYIEDPKDWYTTMRSPYKNILNKFLGSVLKYDEQGNVMTPDPNGGYIDLPIFSKPGGIWDRIRQVMPEHYDQHSTIQTFKYIPEEKIPLLLDPMYQNERKVDFAMNWHRDEHEIDNGMIASFSIYLNDDFEVGELEFMNKPYKIKPKAGRFVRIPVTEEFTHRVTLVKGKDRHTLYGNCWKSQEYVLHTDIC